MCVEARAEVAEVREGERGEGERGEGERGKGEREICILAVGGFDFMPLFILVSRSSLCILSNDLLKK